MATLSIEIDPDDLAAVKRMLSTVENGARDAVRRAANRTATTARSRIVKVIAERLNLTQKRIREDTTITKANYKKLSAEVNIKSNPIPLLDFGAVHFPTKGVRVTVRRGTVEYHPQYFKATMKSSHVGIFRRRYIESLGKRVGRLPIDEAYGPAPAAAFHYNDEPQVFNDMMEIFQKNVLHEADYILSKA